MLLLDGIRRMQKPRSGAHKNAALRRDDYSGN
jgi:hypothetical protein